MNFMNKGAIIGIIIAVAIGIVATSLLSSENIDDTDEVLLSDEEIILDEIIPIEEDLEEESESTGKSIAVELTESIGLKTP